MITVTEYKAFVETMVANIGGFSGLDMVVDETHGTSKLKDKPGARLVAVYPSGSRSGSIDAVREGTSTLLFIVEKPVAGQNDQSELVLYQRLQDLVNKVLKYVDLQSEDGCSLLRNYVPGETQVDPESNMFGGFAGWSISLVF